ncbi:MAG: DUF4926 domain-containing protein [Planctomycetaceae bacterium]|nr:DUF4926 domain-containing protein [Planctomycetaceae bacterium]
MIPREHELVVLLVPVAECALEAGDVGTVVHVYEGNAAFEVEFVTLDGHTTAVVTLKPDQVRPVTPRDMMHSRERQPA